MNAKSGPDWIQSHILLGLFPIKTPHTYSPVHKCWLKTSWAGNQGEHKDFDPSLLPKNLWLLFMGFSKKNPKWPTQKNYVFQNRQFSIFFSQNWAGLVLGSVELIDAKGINVTQPIWSSGCPTQGLKQAKDALLCILPVLGLMLVGQADNHFGWATLMPFALIILLTQGSIPLNFAKNIENWRF